MEKIKCFIIWDGWRRVGGGEGRVSVQAKEKFLGFVFVFVVCSSSRMVQYRFLTVQLGDPWLCKLMP
jgi:hypothetical protein